MRITLHEAAGYEDANNEAVAAGAVDGLAAQNSSVAVGTKLAVLSRTVLVYSGTFVKK